MLAGRELDALVAEKVMGLNVQPCRKIGEPFAIANKDGQFDKFIPHYSTDIGAAWQVVEKLGNWRGFTFMVKRNDDGSFDAGWYEYDFEGPESRVASLDQPTAPLAICLAALKAVGYEPKETL